MNKVLALLVGLLSYSFASADTATDFSMIDHLQSDFSKMGSCVEAGWKAANPTPQEQTQAEAFMAQSKQILEQSKPTITADKNALKTAWQQQPISADAVQSAVTKLRNDVDPVRDSVRGNTISTINLLTSSQRTAFDTAFMQCLNAGGNT